MINKQFFKELLSTALRFCIITFSFFVCIRIYEFIALSHYSYVRSVSTFSYALLLDLIVICRLTLVLTIVQGLINFGIRKKIYFLFYIFPPLFILIELGLVGYFIETNSLLNEVVYFLSFQDLQTILTSTSLTIKDIFALILLLVSYYLVAKLLKKRLSTNHFLYVLSSMAIIALIPAISGSSKEQYSKIENNKISYFVQRSITYLSKNEEIKKQGIKAVNISDFNGIDSLFFGGKARDKNYPLFHELPEQSGLSNYLNPTSDGKAPNIVFIICESLGNVFIGDSAVETGQLMPFLDSLKDKSLYWPNLLSLCDRTYNVLPATLASLPTLTRANLFHELPVYPLHLSLMTQLRNTHFSRFYCGADLNFTQMGKFMYENNTSYLVHDWEKSLSNTINGKPTTWGYHEEELFAKSWFDYQKQNLATKKRLDVFLTVTTHHPFELKNKQFYVNRAKKLLLKSKQKKSKEFQYVQENIEKFATFTYLDTQLEKYFEQAKKCPDYQNTIFIIMGDHGSDITVKDNLSRYRTAFMIYSPLIKKPNQFKGVSSQLDVAPTLINYLRTNYIKSIPKQTTYLGKELSFSKEYENNRLLFIGSNADDDEFLLNRQFYMFHEELLKVGANLSVQSVDDSKIHQAMKQQRNKIRNLVDYLVYQNKFAPPSFINPFFDNPTNLLSETKAKELTCFAGTEYVNIGKDVYFKKSTNSLFVNFGMDYYAKTEKINKELPVLTVSISDAKGNAVMWKQIPYNYNPFSKIKQQAFNRVVAKGEIDLESLGLKKGEKYRFTYYLLNTKKENFFLKKSDIKIYAVNK